MSLKNSCKGSLFQRNSGKQPVTFIEVNCSNIFLCAFPSNLEVTIFKNHFFQYCFPLQHEPDATQIFNCRSKTLTEPVKTYVYKKLFQLKMYLTQGEVLVLWVVFVVSCVMKPLSTEPVVFRQSVKIKISPILTH